MRFTKKKDSADTIRKVWDDTKTTCYGIVGTVADLERQNIIYDNTADPSQWLFLPTDHPDNGKFGTTREEAVQHLYK